MGDAIYTQDTGAGEQKEFTLSILTEDRAGLLNQITIVFLRRKVNIASLNVSSSEVKGVSRFTITVACTQESINKIVRYIGQIVEVLGVFVYQEHQVYYREIALYKVKAVEASARSDLQEVVKKYAARILVSTPHHIIIEKTGTKIETHQMSEELRSYGPMEFVRSGRVALSKSLREAETYIDELEKSLSNQP